MPGDPGNARTRGCARWRPGTVLPAVITFITGLLTYLFGKDSLAEWRPVIPVCVIALLITALFGSLLGAQTRLDSDESEKEYKEWLLYQEHVAFPVAKAGHLKNLDARKLAPNEKIPETRFDPMFQK